MATKAIIFDSNVWVGYFNLADTTHTQAVKYFKKYSNHTVVLTEYVLLEVATVLKEKIGYAATNNIISALLQTENIKLLPSSEYFSITLKKFLAFEDKHLSFVDVSLLALADNFKIITFDKKLLAKLNK
ncbi:MAG TPA: PIN domain-containing protein [Candidatus Paceibacterota bacterium]|nr:PIN domain-containing protein [Candidatus Paceibacterota bacterium]HMO82824.1 PIN domain-containing protein [Candidatus Paceibacterota bacterium]